MHILISGGCGFIGSKLANALKLKGHDLSVLDNLSKQIHGADPDSSPLYESAKRSARVFRGDVRDRAAWEQALVGVEAVVNFAAETGTGQSMYEVSRYTDVNVGGTALLFDVLGNSHHSIKKLVVASSRAVYGEGKYRCVQHGIVYPESRQDEDMRKGDFSVKCPACGVDVSLEETSEDSAKHPSSLYGLTKQVQEEMSLLLGRSLGIPTTALRYQNVYGPGQSLSNPYTGILSIFSTRLLAGRDINIFEDGKESRDFVFVDDVVDATVLALESDVRVGKVYNVGTGVATDVQTVAETLKRAYGSSSSICISGNYRTGDIRHNIADISAIKKDLGFNPSISFQQGIERFASWVRSSAIPEDKYDESLAEMKQRGLFK